MKAENGSYERPLVEPDNLMTGGFQSARFDASPRASTGREASIWALVLAVLWIGGLGSLAALGCGVLALSSGDIGTRYRWFAGVAIGLSLLGLAGSVAMFVR